MPKLRKEKIDEIRRLGAEGYTNTEIAERLGVSRGTARKYRVGADSPLILNDTDGLPVSSDLMKRLYDLQGILGSSSVADAVEQAYRDEVTAAKFRLNAWEEYAREGEEFSIDGMVNYLLAYNEDLRYDLEMYEEGYAEDHKKISNLKDQVKAMYNKGYEGGKRDYMIYFNCSNCGKPIVIKPGDEIHRYLLKKLPKAGWQHTSCG